MHGSSGLILSHAIQENYCIIDSIQNILNRPDLKPLTVLGLQDIKHIQVTNFISIVTKYDYQIFCSHFIKQYGSEKENLILRKSLDNSDVIIESDIIKFAVEAIEFKNKLSTHVIISTTNFVKLLKGDDRNLHIGTERYHYRPRSLVYHLNLSQDIIEPLENL